jgi:hypothetical protein
MGVCVCVCVVVENCMARKHFGFMPCYNLIIREIQELNKCVRNKW